MCSDVWEHFEMIHDDINDEYFCMPCMMEVAEKVRIKMEEDKKARDKIQLN